VDIHIPLSAIRSPLRIEYRHSHDLVHGDLHAANILIGETGRACLTDFGLVGFVEATAGTYTSCRGGAGTT